MWYWFSYAPLRLYFFWWWSCLKGASVFFHIVVLWEDTLVLHLYALFLFRYMTKGLLSPFLYSLVEFAESELVWCCPLSCGVCTYLESQIVALSHRSSYILILFYVITLWSIELYHPACAFSPLLLQNRIGADIIMALDDVVRTTITGPRIEEAMYRTLRWIDRCIAGEYAQYMFMIKCSSYIYQS